MVKRVYLFIEGTSDISNGNLREGFRRLLEKKVACPMPTISMGDGKSQTIRKFMKSEKSKLLCDLDSVATERENDLKKNGLTAYKDNVFYMIQEMEAWFISQPTILDTFYGVKISHKLASKNAELFNEPDKELERITKSTKKGSYHKVNHGTELLKLLDATILYNSFEDFKRLIDTLNKP